jgi:hypothetical protein
VNPSDSVPNDSTVSEPVDDSADSGSDENTGADAADEQPLPTPDNPDFPSDEGAGAADASQTSDSGDQKTIEDYIDNL